MSKALAEKGNQKIAKRRCRTVQFEKTLSANQCLLKLGSYFPAETGKTGFLPVLMITFQGDGSQVLEKDIPELKKM